MPSGAINNGLPGLYSLSVARTRRHFRLRITPPSRIWPFSPTTRRIRLSSLAGPIAAGTNPSAIGIDPTLGVVAVVETGSNAVQFYSIGSGTLTPLGGPVPVGNVPTSLSVNRHQPHCRGHQLSGSEHNGSAHSRALPSGSGHSFHLDISGALQGQVTPAPLPYAIGVDPDTNMGVVAYSSTSASSAANLGFLVNLNTGTNPYGCPL